MKKAGLLKFLLVTLVVLAPLSATAVPASAQTEDEKLYCDRNSPTYDRFICNELVRGSGGASSTTTRSSGAVLTCRELLALGPYRALDISSETFDRWNDCFDQAYPSTSKPVQSSRHRNLEQAKSAKLGTCFATGQRCGPEWVLIDSGGGHYEWTLLP